MLGAFTRRIPDDDIHWNERGDLCISTHVEMADWLVREHRKTVVSYQSALYYVSDVSCQAGTFTYILKPWKAGPELAGKAVTYDDDYVRTRNQQARISHRARRLGVVWPVLYLLHGFLWKGARRWIEEESGVAPNFTTHISIALEAAAIAVTSILLCISTWVAAYFITFWFLFEPGYLLLVIVVAIPDVVMRVHYLMEDANKQYGFYEWLRLRRSK